MSLEREATTRLGGKTDEIPSTAAASAVARSAAWNVANTVFVILLGLVITPYQVSRLGIEAFGVLMLETAIISLPVLAATTAARVWMVMAGRHGATIWPRAARFSRLGALAIMVFVGGAGYLLPQLEIPTSLETSALGLFALMGLAQAINMAVAASQARLMFRQRYDLLNQSLVGGQIMQAIVMVVWYEGIGPSLEGTGVAILSGAAVSRVMLKLFDRHGGEDGEPRGVSQEPTDLGALLKLGGSLGLMQLTGVINMQLLQFTANLFLGPAANAVVGLLLTIRNAVGRLNDGVAGPVFAAFATLQSDRERATTLWAQATKHLGFIVTPVCLALLLMPHEVGSVWLGRNGELVAPFLPILALDIALPSLALVTVQLFQVGSGRTWQLGMDLALMVMIGIGLFGIGASEGPELKGLLWIYAGMRSVYGLILVFGFAPHVVAIKGKEILRRVIAPIVVCAAGAGLGIVGSQRWMPLSEAHWRLGIAALVAGIIFLPLLWTFGLDAATRSRIRIRRRESASR